MNKHQKNKKLLMEFQKFFKQTERLLNFILLPAINLRLYVLLPTSYFLDYERVKEYFELTNTVRKRVWVKSYFYYPIEEKCDVCMVFNWIFQGITKKVEVLLSKFKKMNFVFLIFLSYLFCFEFYYRRFWYKRCGSYCKIL